MGVFALVLLNGFFVAAELALVRIRDTQIETLVLKGHRRAKIVRRLIKNLDATISAIQFGITLASLGLGVLVEPVFAALLAPLFDWLGRGIAGGAAYGVDFDGLLRQFVFVDSHWRTRAQGDCDSQDFEGGACGRRSRWRGLRGSRFRWCGC